MKRLLLVLLVLAPAGASARRMPSVGGEVRLALPGGLAESTAAAARGLPLLEPPRSGDPDWLGRAHPPLAGTDLRSQWVVSLVAEDEGRTWQVKGEALVEVLEPCLTGHVAWPAAALRAAGITASVGSRPEGAQLRFNAPVGALPELLAGCTVQSQGGFQDVDGVLTRSRGVGVHRLSFVDPGAAADVIAESAASPGRTLVVSSVESVVLLVQGSATRAQDPLGTGTGLAGLLAFRDLLGPGLMAEVLAGGRAEAAAGVLPSSLIPPRPPQPAMPEGQAASPSPAVAPGLALAPASGELLEGLAGRLAALVGTRGGSLSAGVRPDARLVRWGPASRDPALALLVLAEQHPELRSDALQDPRLLDEDRQRRLEAALDLERRWLDERRVLPLLTARRWISVHEDLYGVRLRADGVPLLRDAWWRVQ